MGLWTKRTHRGPISTVSLLGLWCWVAAGTGVSPTPLCAQDIPVGVDPPTPVTQVDPLAPETAPIQEPPPSEPVLEEKPVSPEEAPLASPSVNSPSHPESATSPSETPTPDRSDPAERKKKKKKKVLPDIEPLALVHGRYEWEPEQGRQGQDYDLTRARIGLMASYGKRVDGKVELDARSSDILKSAWVRMRFMRELRLKAGLFKRSFFKLRMMDPHRMEVINRGSIDRSLKDGMDYSAHKAGVQLEGKLHKKSGLKYKVGFFPDFGLSRGLASADDLLAMVCAQPIKGFEIGAAYELKFLGDDEAHGDRVMGANLFFHVRMKGWSALLEGVIGQDPRYAQTPLFLGGLAMGSYTFSVGDETFLQGIRPAVKVETMDPDANIRDDLSVRGTLGLDLLFAHNVRISVNGERVYKGRNNREGEQDHYLLSALMGWEL